MFKPPFLHPRYWLGFWRKRDVHVEVMLYKAYWANLFAALLNMGQVWRDYVAFGKLRATMRRLAALSQPGKGVHAVHFVYGLKQPEPFPFYAYMAVVSAMARHPNAKVYFFVRHVPTGRYWDLIASRIEIVHVPAFDWFGVARVRHYAHKADVVRMLALYEMGGLYLDCDTLTLASMDHLAGHDFVAGVQQTIPGAKGGFCNAIMMSRPRSRFCGDWLLTYRSFASQGRDDLWDFHSVKLPMYLYAKNSSGVFVLPHDKWFFPLWNHISNFLFDARQREANHELIEGQLAMHLWHNMISSLLDNWTAERMMSEECLYSDLCRAALLALPPQERQRIEAELGISLAQAPESRQQPVQEPA